MSRDPVKAGVFVIAEAGVNHNGSLDQARQLVDVAADAGADAVKFQTFRVESLTTRRAAKADYQMRSANSDGSQFEMLRALELDDDMHRALVEHCGQRGIEFMSTPFDLESLAYLVDDIGVTRLKIPSGEITNAPLLMAAARSGKPIILSTGMATLAEIQSALAVLAFGYTGNETQPATKALADAFRSPVGQAALAGNVALLHCTTEYPTPFRDVNLRAMDQMADRFGLVVGYSDHTLGLSVPIAAVARGAQILEKHFTLDRTMDGPDHAASLEPDELSAMIRSIREIEVALGNSEKAPVASELANIKAVRKSLVALSDIKAGEVFGVDNLAIKRPGDGRSPMTYWDVLGTPSSRDYAKDEAID
jgi:N-acetylneuraminate synthase